MPTLQPNQPLYQVAGPARRPPAPAVRAVRHQEPNKDTNNMIRSRSAELAGAVAGVVLVLLSGQAIAGQSGPSEEAVRTMMADTWSQIPEGVTKVTLISGRTIVFDKKKRNEIEVPLAAAREVVIAAYRTYEAQICGLPEEEVANRDSLMAREKASKQWTEQQLQYIHLLHRTVIMFTAGQRVRTIGPDGSAKLKWADIPKDQIATEKGLPQAACPEERRKRVKEAVAAYVKSGPPITAGAPVTPGVGGYAVLPADAVAPVSTTDKAGKKK